MTMNNMSSHSGSSKCQGLFGQLRSTDNDPKRWDYINAAKKKYAFTCNDAYVILTCFSESSRLSALGYLLDNISDPQNKDVILDAFSFSGSTKVKAEPYIRYLKATTLSHAG
jgi:hypothetical protein